MTGTQEILALALGGLVLLWLGLALYVLLTRVLHDAHAAVMHSARSVVERKIEAAAAGDEAELRRLVRRLPRRALERFAADTATPEPVARAFAQHVLERYPERVLRWAQSTAKRHEWQRVRALRILARANRLVAVPLLVQATRDGDEHVRAAAVATLGSMRDRLAAIALVDVLREDRFSRSRVATQLDEFELPIAHLLLPLLDDFDPQVRFWGATLLARYSDEEQVVLELAAATGDMDASVRAAAIQALSRSGRPAALGAALALLDDPAWFVRARAARALRRFARPEVAARLAPLLADEQWWVRDAAKDALSAAGPQVAAVLASYLEHDDEFARNCAAEVLQNVGTLDAILMDAVREPDDAEKVAAAARLVRAGGREVVDASVKRLPREHAQALLQLADRLRDVG
jgi:HEAT repeat protein